MQLLKTAGRSSGFPSSDAAPKTLGEAIFRRLRQDILSGKLKPGSKLRFTDLTSNYDAGTSTTREALSRLTADHLVIAEGQRGFRVAPISLAELWDITMLRVETESLALEASIDVGDDAWEANILACQHRLSKFQGRGGPTLALLTEEGATLHKLFHMSLLGACPSIWRLRVVEALYDQSERYRRLQTFNLPDVRNSAQEHCELMEAVVGRDKQQATALLALHLKKTADALSTVEKLWISEECR